MSESAATATTTDPDGEELTTTSSSGTTAIRGGSHSEVEGESWGWQEGLEPLLEWLHTQGYSLEEQIHRAVAYMINQPVRQAIVKIPARRSVRMRVPLIKEGIANEERVARFTGEAALVGDFATPVTQIEQEAEARRARLLNDARDHVYRKEEPDDEEDQPDGWA